MAEVRYDFPSQYKANLEDYIPPGGVRVLYFPDAASGSGGLIVAVRPSRAEPWTGVFAYGKLATRAFSGLLTCPNDLQLCVVSRGEGYLVDVDKPTVFEQVKASPIMSVHPVVERGLLIFADPWELFAYGRAGFLWRTGRIAVEGLAVSEVTRDYIRGECDRLDQESAGFVVNLETGAVNDSSG